MVKKNYSDSLFVYLDWVLKKKTVSSIEAPPTPFIINRWLSMADPSIAQIINVTSNRWITIKNGIASNSIDMGKMFRTILPKITKKTSYIKKSIKEKNTEDHINIAKAMECSTKEIEMFEKTLAEIKQAVK
jgi:hypothetical protein